MEYTVKIDDLTFGYGGRTILQNVSMRFGAGKVVAIMGGSGMGKTTLLKLIGGLLTPQSGEITIAGEQMHTGDQKSLYRLRRCCCFSSGHCSRTCRSLIMWLSPCVSRLISMKKRFEI